MSYWLCSNDKAYTNQMFTESQSDIVYAGDNSGGQDEVGWCFSCRVVSASQKFEGELVFISAENSLKCCQYVF